MEATLTLTLEFRKHPFSWKGGTMFRTMLEESRKFQTVVQLPALSRIGDPVYFRDCMFEVTCTSIKINEKNIGEVTIEAKHVITEEAEEDQFQETEKDRYQKLVARFSDLPESNVKVTTFSEGE